MYVKVNPHKSMRNHFLQLFWMQKCMPGFSLSLLLLITFKYLYFKEWKNNFINFLYTAFSPQLRKEYPLGANVDSLDMDVKFN